MISSTILFILFLIPFLLSVAFVTLTERKILSLIGLRLGPNKVIFYGLGQPIMDALKLMTKQVNSLMNFSYFFYYMSSGCMLVFSMMLWLSSGFNFAWASSHPMLMIMMILSFNSLALMLAGWSVFSKFSLLGSIRTVSLLISYESILYFCFLLFLCLCSSFGFQYFFYMESSLVFLCPFLFMSWVFSMLADLNRTPFDFSEGESELVSGFNTEFGSSGFTLLFLSEYSNILFFSVLTGSLFFSYGLFFFSLFTFMFIIWIRSVLPRHRFDKLMSLAWKILIPLVTLIFLILILEVI